jgi:peptidoglycan/LPS O-acetylase OafA/YrhL
MSRGAWYGPTALTATAERSVHAPSPAPPDLGLRTEFRYKPALDGLRAIAVLSVLAYHFGADWAHGGFLGVDMFFVLSGYLITSLLLVERMRSGTIRFGAFWARRARRLLPALFLVLIAVSIWSRIELQANQWSAFRADSLWTFFYGANWHFIEAGQSYFTADPSPLRHAWSLAIEEQFYLVWPLIVFGALKLARGRHWFITALSVLGIGASLYAMRATFTDGGDPSRAYYGTDARASQLLVGALLAVLLIHWTPRARAARVVLQWLAVAASIAIVYAFVAASDTGSFLYRGGFLAFAVCTALVIAAVVQPTRNPLRAGLSLTPVRWIGQVSYGVYLWHWPVAIALNPARTDLDGWSLAVLRVAVTFAIAAVSYYLVEAPIRQRRFSHVWTPRIALPAAASVTVAAILVATAGAAPPDPLAGRPGTVLESASDVAPPVVANPSTAAPTQRTLLVGDSVAYTLQNPLTAEAAKRGVTLRSFTRLGCGLTDGVALLDDGQPVSWSARCAADTAQYLDTAFRESTPDTVLWFSTWELSDYEIAGKRLVFGTPAFDQWLQTEFEAVRRRAAATGARLAFVTIPPKAQNPTMPLDPEQTRRARHLTSLFERYAVAHPTDVTIVDLATIVCPGGEPCPVTMDGIVLRPKDGMHYEVDGANWVAPRLLNEVFKQLDSLERRQLTTTTTSAGNATTAGR